MLRDLDRLEADPARKGPKARAKRTKKAAPEPAASVPRQAMRHPLLAGFGLGAGMMGLVAVLIFFAQGDARPKPEEPQAGPAATGSAPFDRGEPQLPPQVAAQVQQMRSQLADGPENLALRKQLAELLIAHGQFFDAFQEGQSILAIDPDDPDGHYVAGVVRLTMGQPEAAVEHLDRTLAARPDHAPAAMMRGLLLLQLGDREGAMAGWRRGLEAVGGSHPGLEHVLQLAEQGRTAQEILASPPL